MKRDWMFPLLLVALALASLFLFFGARAEVEPESSISLSFSWHVGNIPYNEKVLVGKRIGETVVYKEVVRIEEHVYYEYYGSMVDAYPIDWAPDFWTYPPTLDF